MSLILRVLFIVMIVSIHAKRIDKPNIVPQIVPASNNTKFNNTRKCEFRKKYGEHIFIGGKMPHKNLHIRRLILCDWPSPNFNLSSLDVYNTLESFWLIRSSVTQFVGQLSLKLQNLHSIRLNNLSIVNFNENLFTGGSHSLKLLDLRNNSLQMISQNILEGFPNIRSLYIGGNPIYCTDQTWENMNWMWNNSRVADLDKVACDKNGPLYNRKPLKLMLSFIKDAIDTCPKSCKCILPHVVNDPERGLTPLVTVNCKNLNLTTIPPSIPINTTIIFLDNNRISSLKPLVENKAYSTVVDVYLENNDVTSIDNLEGTYWLSHFRILSLRGNKIENVPTYALDNALSKNDNVARLLLGNNPWICECEFTPGFQELLLKYQSYIKDIDDVFCLARTGNGVSLMPVRSISLKDVCKSKNAFDFDPLLILNWVFISLIIIIFTKLAFDYYFYRKTGKLPWIATKIP